MKISREIKAAILVVASILLFIWGYSFLKGSDLLSSKKIFYVEYDNVEGLAQSAPVTISGLVVGKVNKITLDNKTAKLLVEILITDKDFPISKTSKVNIYEPGLIGGKQIQIVPDMSNPELAQSGDRLQGHNVPGLTSLVGEQLTPLKAQLEKVLADLNVTISSVNNILDAKSQQHLKATMASLSNTMAQLERASGSVNGILDSNKTRIDNVLLNFEQVSGDFKSLSGKLEQAELDKAAESLKNSLANLDQAMAKINSAEGTLGQLIHDPALYENLERTTRELELLLQDLRLNPTRYVNISVFGKKNKPYVAPAADTTSN